MIPVYVNLFAAIAYVSFKSLHVPLNYRHSEIFLAVGEVGFAR